jgi:outer membrane protein W
VRFLLVASLLMVGCAHRPSNTAIPVRTALAGLQTRTSAVISEIAASSTNAAASAQSLRMDLDATILAFDQFEVKYTSATNKVESLEASVSKLSSARNFWRGVFFAAVGTLLLALAILIVPKIP